MSVYHVPEHLSAISPVHTEGEGEGEGDLNKARRGGLKVNYAGDPGT